MLPHTFICFSTGYNNQRLSPQPYPFRYFDFKPGPLHEADILDCLDQLYEGGDNAPRCEISVKDLKETIDVLGFTPEEIDCIFRALSGIAKLSLLEFEGDEEAQLSGDRALFESICSDFALEPAQLEYALLTHVVELPGNQQVEKK